MYSGVPWLVYGYYILHILDTGNKKKVLEACCLVLEKYGLCICKKHISGL